MRDGAVPAALLFTALGLALSLAPRGAWIPSLCVLLVSVAAFTFLHVPPAWLEAAFLGCWISVIATAASVHVLRRLAPWVAFALSLNAGIWASAVVSLSGSRLDLLKALPCVLIALPAAWLMRRDHPIPIKVISSWVIAIAFLAATLQWLPVTPGYLPDHLE